MKYYCSLLLMLVAGLQFTLAQDVADCTDISEDLQTTPITPVIVPDLPVCVDQRAVAQCCSAQFIQERRNLAEQNFIEGLRIELQERFQDFLNLTDSLRAFLEGDFLTSYLSNFRILGGQGTNGVINNFIADLQSRFDYTPGEGSSDESSRTGRSNSTNGFNIQRFLGDVLSGVENAAIRRILGGRNNSLLSECIGQVIQDQIQEQQIQAQGEALDEIRRATASLERLREFVSTLINDLAGFRPLQECIDTLVQLDTCGRCTAVRPPLCQNVCAAIASACYSPFNDALEDQLELLWDVVEQIVDNVTQAAIDSLRANLMLNRTAIISEISSQCNVTIRLRRQVSDDDNDDDDIPQIPGPIRMLARSLSGGPFAYNGRNARGPGLCRLIDTSTTDCWDGTQNTTNDMIDDFDDDDIIDQVNNPVITIPQQVLTDQATSLGTPVSTVLNSPSFADVAPLGLVIPAGNGATAAMATFTSTLLVLTVSVLFML